MPRGKDLGRLIADFVTTGVLVTVDGREQQSGVSANDFSRPVYYDVTADDGTAQRYTAEVLTHGDLAGLWNFEYPAPGEYTVVGAHLEPGLFGNAMFFEDAVITSSFRTVPGLRWPERGR
jgi:hypothetical protein